MDVALPVKDLYAFDGQPGERIAITCSRTGASLTHRELAADTRVISNALSRLGLVPGDTIGYRVADGLGFYALAAACFTLDLRLRILDGALVQARNDGPKLIISPSEPIASASE